MMNNFSCVSCKGEEKDSIYNEIRGVDDEMYSLIKCKKCDLSQIFPLPDDDCIKKFYEKNYNGRVKKGICSPGGVNENRAIIEDCTKKTKIIKKISGIHSGKLLDVASGHGFFVYAAKEQGFDAVGIDIDNEALEYSNNILNVKCLNMDINYLSQIDTKYDIITLWMILEHLKNPKKILDSSFDLLNQDGIVAGAVPNIKGIGSLIQRKKWYLLVPPEHLIYFSKETLSKMLTNAGFEILFIGTIPLYASPYFKTGLRKKIATASAQARNPVLKKLYLGMHRTLTLIKRYLFYLPLNLIICSCNIPGNSLFFIAKKTLT